jgi:hypothetical protein
MHTKVIGGATVPCSAAITAVCVGAAALQSICAGQCPP